MRAAIAIVLTLSAALACAGCAIREVSASPTTQAPSREFCVRTHAEPSIPVDDAYSVIGKAPKSGVLYSGRVTTRFDTDHYVLARTDGGETIAGEAWTVACGPDEVELLEVRYATAPVETRFACKLTVNYDNYSLASCGPLSNGNHDDIGLEAWFPDPAVDE